MEQIEKEKIQSNKGSSYKLLVEQAKLKQATSKVSNSSQHRHVDRSHTAPQGHPSVCLTVDLGLGLFLFIVKIVFLWF